MVDYFATIFSQPVSELPILTGHTAVIEPITHVIFPITSANQHGSRYNPVPLYARVIGLERTIAPIRETYGIKVSYVPVPHIASRSDFAAYILKHVATHLEQELAPTSTVVWTSTEALIADFNQLGFPVLPAEWDVATLQYAHKPPTQIIRELVTAPWGRENPAYRHLSDATGSLWNDMPEIPAHIIRLWNDPILTDSGSLTDTRNYGVYTVGMGQADVLDVKFADIKHAVKEGRIVDEVVLRVNDQEVYFHLSAPFRCGWCGFWCVKEHPQLPPRWSAPERVSPGGAPARKQGGGISVQITLTIR